MAKTLTVAIDIETDLQDDFCLVEVDASEFEDAILNMALNAKDAMTDGGTLTIITRNIVLDDDYVQRNAGSTTGEHVMVKVSDTGDGIENSVMDKILEPFFTTKPVGAGTGLGLSTSFNIIERHGGRI